MVTLDAVRGWPDVVEARHDSDRLRIIATDAEAVRRLLTAGLSEALAAKPRTRPGAQVDAELREIRNLRRVGWRRRSD